MHPQGLTLPLTPSHQGREDKFSPSPLRGEGWGEGETLLKAPTPLSALTHFGPSFTRPAGIRGAKHWRRWRSQD
jgi:hypothetical protein